MTTQKDYKDNMDSEVNLKDVHYCPLSSQSTVYGMCHVVDDNGDVFILAASHGKVLCLSYHQSDGELLSTCKYIQFPLIPVDSDIISIDAFPSYSHSFGKESNVTSVAIAFIKSSDDKVSPFLNIYPEWSSLLGSSAPGGVLRPFSIKLYYSPLYLTHWIMKRDGGTYVVWLLAGTDQQMHIYYEDRYLHVCEEQDIHKFFPEFSDLPACVLWFDIVKVDQYKRLTALGCDDGNLRIFMINCEDEWLEPIVISTWSVKLDSPITVVKWIDLGSVDDNNGYSSSPADRKSLVVTSAIEETVCYQIPIEENATVELDDPIILRNSDEYDSVLCCCVADVNFDGHLEVILGTYGQQILIYQEVRDGYSLLDKLKMGEPILSILHMDVTGDGVGEVLALGLHGLHILQHDPQSTASLVHQRLLMMEKTTPSSQDAFRILQSESL